MNAFRRFLEDGATRRGWSQSDLARESGISKQVISNILKDTRTHLDRLPQDKTIDGIARAFDVDRMVVLSEIAQAMGLPVRETVVRYDASGVADADLVRELARRLGVASLAGGEDQEQRTGALSPEDLDWAARAGEPALGSEPSADGSLPGESERPRDGAEAGPV